METNADEPKSVDELKPVDAKRAAAKPRKLPEIPKDQEPYDVTKPPRKPARLLPTVVQGSASSDLQRSKYNLHKRSKSMTDLYYFTPVKLEEDSETMYERRGKPERSKSTSLNDLTDQDGATVFKQCLNNPLCSNDAILSRRCGSCHQRIFPEKESCLTAQSYLFHTTCFSCAICNSTLDVTNYCYFTEHEKFYCFQHFHEISKAEQALGNERSGATGVGPGALAGAVLSYSTCYSQQRKRKQMVKMLIELQQRRTILEKVTLQLEETRENAEREDKLLLWKHWFDMTYEKTMIMKGVTELAYQIKESELFEEQEQIQRKLRRLKKRRDEGTREENTEQEKKCLQCVLDVIEKRDLLLLELEIERRRDDEDVQNLKSAREQTENVEDPLHSEKHIRGESSYFSSNELLEDCVIL